MKREDGVHTLNKKSLQECRKAIADLGRWNVEKYVAFFTACKCPQKYSDMHIVVVARKSHMSMVTETCKSHMSMVTETRKSLMSLVAKSLPGHMSLVTQSLWGISPLLTIQYFESVKMKKKTKKMACFYQNRILLQKKLQIYQEPWIKYPNQLVFAKKHANLKHSNFSRRERGEEISCCLVARQRKNCQP